VPPDRWHNASFDIGDFWPTQIPFVFPNGSWLLLHKTFIGQKGSRFRVDATMLWAHPKSISALAQSKDDFGREAEIPEKSLAT
jgi:hypothetical protein